MTGILSLLSGHLFGWVAGAIVAVAAAALLGGSGSVSGSPAAAS